MKDSLLRRQTVSSLPQAFMSAPRLIICERSPRWLAAWRRALPTTRWGWLTSAVSLAQAESRLLDAPGSIVAVSIEADQLPAALTKLHQWRNNFPRARFLALLNGELARDSAIVPLLQEAGALLVIDRNEQLRSAARLASRHFRRHVAAELPWREAIWQRLPWPQFATASSK